jgi:DNA-binding CsgD family transcriptional regulator
MAQAIPLIGREREMRRLAELLGRVAPGRPAVLVVEGPPDSGRTRLLREFAIAGRGLGAAEAAAHDRVVLVRARPAPIEPGDLDRLAASAPVLVITTGQPIDLTMPAEVHRIRLAPLSPGEVRRLVAALLGMRPGDRLLDLARVAAGRPGAVVDLIAGLREEGLLRIDHGSAVPVSARLPERTRERLADRLATLSPPARHLVQAASALRSPFAPARLSGLLASNIVTLLPAIEEALDSGLLVAAEDALSFSHDLVRPIVEASMPRAVVAALRKERGGSARPPVATRHRPPRDTRSAIDWGLLSERELEIAELVGQALTNRQIASRVGRSPHTVNYHLRHIFRKLGLASRVELVSLLRRREAGDHEAAAAAP